MPRRVAGDQVGGGDRAVRFVGARLQNGQRAQVDVAAQANNLLTGGTAHGLWRETVRRPAARRPALTAQPALRPACRSSASVRSDSSSSGSTPRARQAALRWPAGWPRSAAAAAHAVEQQGRSAGLCRAAGDFGQFALRIDLGRRRARAAARRPRLPENRPVLDDAMAAL